MYGDVSAWMYKTLAGIRPDPNHPGFKHFFIHPYFPEKLQWIKASHQTMYGEIAVNWEKADKGFRIEISVPVNTSATVTFPISDAELIREGGNGLDKSEITDIGKEGGLVRLTIGSGQ